MNYEPTLRDCISVLCDNSEGATAREVADAIGQTTHRATTHLQRMVNQGRIHKGQRAGTVLHFFANAAERDTWVLRKESGHNAQTTGRRESPLLVSVHEHLKSKARRPGLPPLLLNGSMAFHRNKGTTAAPVSFDPDQFKLVGDMLMKADTVHTVCKSATHDPRYQLGPDDSIERAFSSAPPGHYIADPSPWAAAAIQARG